MPHRAEFDRYSDSYREAVEESIAFAGADLDVYTRAKAEELLELAGCVGPPHRLAFLDVGCGIGDTDRFLEGRVGRLAGVDVAPKMLESARARNPWAEYRDYDAGEPIPFADESFDVCFAVCVFHHIPRDQRARLVGEMRRVCRRGGLVAIFEHNPLNPLTRRAVRDCPFDDDAVLLRRGEARRLIEGSGMKRVESPFIIFFPRQGERRDGIERRLGWLPLGAQYYVAGRRTDG